MVLPDSFLEGREIGCFLFKNKFGSLVPVLVSLRSGLRLKKSCQQLDFL